MANKKFTPEEISELRKSKYDYLIANMLGGVLIQKKFNRG